MIRFDLWTITALCLLAPTSVRSDCLPPGSGMQMKTPPQATLRATLAPTPAKIAVGAPFSVEIRVCDEGGGRIERVSLDATMPAHRHGMNYAPSVVAIGDGRYHAKGMLFHMPGRWEVVVTVFGSAAPTRLTLDLDIR